MICIVEYCQYFLSIMIFDVIFFSFFANCNMKKICVILQLSISIHYSEKCDTNFRQVNCELGRKLVCQHMRVRLHTCMSLEHGFPLSAENPIGLFLRQRTSVRSWCMNDGDTESQIRYGRKSVDTVASMWYFVILRQYWLSRRRKGPWMSEEGPWKSEEGP